MPLLAFLPNFGVPEVIVLLLVGGVVAFVVVTVLRANRPKRRPDRREGWEREDD